MIRKGPAGSLIRSSWQCGPITGIGHECGRLNVSPRCNSLSRYPASILASLENGGVFTSPRSQTIGLPASGLLTYAVRPLRLLYVRCDIVSIRGTPCFPFKVTNCDLDLDTGSLAKVTQDPRDSSLRSE